MTDEQGGPRRYGREGETAVSSGPPGFVTERTPGTKPAAQPWLFAPFDAADQAALKALRDGTASPHQQQRALGWVLFAAGLYDQTWRPGGTEGQRASDFAQGARHVGLQIRRLMDLPSLGSAKGGEQGDT